MWIVLAVISFLLAQLYLFRCLGRLDTVLDGQKEEKQVLSVALTDPVLEKQLSGLLEGYSLSHPNVDLVIHIDPKAMEAQRKADVCLCPEEERWGGGNCLTLTFPESIRQQVIWKNKDNANEFVYYLWQECRKEQRGVI